MEILNEDDLLSAVNSGTFIKDGSTESCEGIKYDFILSNMALTVDSGRPRNIDQSHEGTVIRPGEVAFVMTKESLELPDNIYCQLSTKRKLSLDGIVILGGLIIDPNYKGRLIFGLYNLSSRNYPLLPGRKLVAGVFYRLDKKSDKVPDPINTFPDELIKIVVDTKPNSINTVNTSILNINKALEDLRADMQQIRNQVERDDKWRVDFQSGLVEIRQLVQTIGEKLNVEIDTRQSETHQLKNSLVDMKESTIPLAQVEKRLHFYKSVIAAIATGVAVFLITQIVYRLF